MRIDLLDRHVQRQDHERQEVVGQAGDDRERAGEDVRAGIEEADVLERAQDHAVVGQDLLPGQRPDDERREEGQDDEQQQDVLEPTAAVGDRPRDRVAEHERGEGHDDGVDRAIGRTAAGRC